MIQFTIPLPPISKKNSQQIMTNSSTGKLFIVPSRAYKEYESAAMWYIPKQKPIDTAVNVKCLFYMKTLVKCDLTNMLEAVDDIMVKAGLLLDDNYTIIQSHDGSRVLLDRENPRTEVFIELSADQPAAAPAKSPAVKKREKKALEMQHMSTAEYKAYIAGKKK